MFDLENNLKTDAHLVTEAIKANKKSGVAMCFQVMLLTLEQAYSEGKYEPAEAFAGQFPDNMKDIQNGDDYIQIEQKQTALLYHLWHEIYHAAAETKNQIGLDEMMEWGKAFAMHYADFQVALENQKNYISCHLPAMAEIKALKADLEKAKTTPESSEDIEIKLKRVRIWVSSPFFPRMPTRISSSDSALAASAIFFSAASLIL